MTRLRLAPGLVALAATITLAAPNSASALTHLWGPYPDATWYLLHYDPDPTFHSWAGIIAGSSTSAGFSWPVPQICAEAITEAKNIRTGSGCNYGAADRGSILAGPTPYSRGFVWYRDPTYVVYLAGRSDT